MCDVSMVAERVFKAFRAWRGYPAVSRVMDEFPDLEVSVAGGVVRNLILDPSAKVKDFDLLFGGTDVTRAFDRLEQTGRTTRGVFGNIHWYPHPDEPIRGDLIPVSNFNWIWPSRTILDALTQFDFTGNAIAVELRTGNVLDPVNGIQDLQRRLMRAVRYDWPDEPIIPGNILRRPVCNWYRVLHYAAALDLQIDPVTMRWLLDHREYREYREAYAGQFKKPHPKALLVYDRVHEERGPRETGMFPAGDALSLSSVA